MEKREYEVMWNYYLGMSKVPMIWEKELEELHISQVIRKIYEVIDNDFNEIWYLVRTNDEKSYILKSKCGNLYAKDIMQKYRELYNFYEVSTEIIKIYEKGYYPVVFKVSENDFFSFYNEKNNKSQIFFNNYYCYSKNQYKAVREFRNKVEYEIFDKEEDTVYWLSDFAISKDEILKNNIRPLNLMERVYEYRKDGG